MKKNLVIVGILFTILVCTLVGCSFTTCADGHTWKDGEITRQATCDTVGEMSQTCGICGATRTVATDALGHKFDAWMADEDGLTHSRICTVDASHIEKANHVDGNADQLCDVCAFEMVPAECQHQWGNWIDNGDGTCTRVCSLDDEHVESGAHIDEDENELCDNCEANLHTCTWSLWTSNNDGTHTRECELDETHIETENCIGGTADCEHGAICDVCNFEYTNALGHEWGVWTSLGNHEHSRVCANDSTHVETLRCSLESVDFINASCESEGYTLCICSDCGFEHHADVIDPVGHDMIKNYVVENGKLYWVEHCNHDCGLKEVKEQINGVAEVATAEDLRIVLENGFSARLVDDITLTTGSIEITSGNVVLDLNGHNITSTGLKQSSTTGLMDCDVIIAKGASTKLQIVGEGTLLAQPTPTALEGVDEDDLSICVLSALDGAFVEIQNGTFHSTGCKTIFACTASRVNIYGGRFVAEESLNGTRYTLDILESEIEEDNFAHINVYGGEFVDFDPSNHTGDAGYSSKVAVLAHVVQDGNVYTVEEHNIEGDNDLTACCTTCGFYLKLKTKFSDGDRLYVMNFADEGNEIYGIFTLESVDGEEDTYYMYFDYAGKYFTRLGDDIILTTEKTEDSKWIITARYNLEGEDVYNVSIGIPNSDYVSEGNNMFIVGSCKQHNLAEIVYSDYTCTGINTVRVVCEHCGEDYSVIETQGTGHVTYELSRVPATCTEPEIITYDCSECSEGSYTEVGEPALGHNYIYADNGDGTCTGTCSRNCVEGHTIVESHINENGDCACDNCGAELHVLSWTDLENGTCVIGCNNCDYTGEATSHVDENEDNTCDNCSATLIVKPELIEETATLTFDDVAKRTAFSTTQQVWEENGIVFKNDKAESTASVANYSAPVRCYKSSTILIEYVGMTKIVFNCNSKDSTASFLKDSIINAGFTATISGNVVTVEFDTPVDSLSVSLSSGKVFIDSITVSSLRCAGEHTDEDEDEICDNCKANLHQHNYVAGTPVAPTCTAEGYTMYTCYCGSEYKDDVVGATGHSYLYVDSDGKCLQTCASCDFEKEISHVDEDADNVCDNCEAELSADDVQKQEVTYTITFDASKAQRTEYSTSKQVWEDDQLVLTNNKASSTSNVGDYTNPGRFYKSSEITIECAGMTQIVFDCSNAGDTKYKTAILESIQAAITAGNIKGTVANNNNVFTLTLTEETDSISFALTAQGRVNSITVTAMQ